MTKKWLAVSFLVLMFKLLKWLAWLQDCRSYAGATDGRYLRPGHQRQRIETPDESPADAKHPAARLRVLDRRPRSAASWGIKRTSKCCLFLLPV
jgi:hypothetical protein